MSSRRKTIPLSSLVWGLVFGIVFGFLLQRGGLTRYDVIIGQLLLRDFTMLKVMLSAVLVGMIGIHIMKHLKWIEFQPKAGSAGRSIIGGLIFGIGFAILGYCPGTAAGAVGNGYLDAAVGGIVGIITGASVFAAVYGRVRDKIMDKGSWGNMTLPRLFKVNDRAVVIPAALLILLFLAWLELQGF